MEPRVAEPWEQAFRDLERRVTSIQGKTEDGIFIRKELFDVYMSQLSSDLTEARLELAQFRTKDMAELHKEMRDHEEAGRVRREAEALDRRAFSRSVILLVLGAVLSGILSLTVVLLK